jgi:hypothetical protein
MVIEELSGKTNIQFIYRSWYDQTFLSAIKFDMATDLLSKLQGVLEKSSNFKNGQSAYRNRAITIKVY